jgi:hypothetical protein
MTQCVKASACIGPTLVLLLACFRGGGVMGFLDWLRGNKGEDELLEGEQPRFNKTVTKLHKKLMNKYVQTLERKRIIGTLADIGSDDAITALLGRFTYVTDGSIVDEDEKELTYEVIRTLGNRALPPLRRVVMEEAAIYWPLKALTEIGGEELAVSTLLEALAGITDRFDRSMERMTNIVSCFRDYQHPEILSKLIELAADESEEIRFLAVDGLTTFDDHQEAVDAIIKRMVDDEETTRVKTYIMDVLMERQWNVKKYKKELLGKLPETYFVDDTGVIQRRYQA